MVKNILFDLDGVLVDWKGGVCKLLDIDEYDPIARKILKSDGPIEGYKFGTTNDVDNIVQEAGYEFWRNLELLPWAMELWDEINSLGKEVFIVSASGKFHAGAHAKLDYILEKLNTRKYVLTKYKYLCANPQSILIDDFYRNVKEFQKAGGIAYEWPNQYKIIDGEEDYKLHIQRIKELII